MGGQNHQPTNQIRLIAPSAWLSQRVGEGFVAVLQANNELENAIMAAMDRLHVEAMAPAPDRTPSEYLGTAIDKLTRSIGIVDEIQDAYANLLDAAAAENYTGNPLVSKLKSFRLDEAFSGDLVIPALNASAWKPLEDRISEDNILKTLEWEATEFKRVVQPTKALIAVLNECVAIDREDGSRRMVEAIECNEVMLRQEFARVFSCWNHLHGLFLYSALAMTELFYRTNDFGSLLDQNGGRGISEAVA
jgi:hypothetical protein